MGLARRVAAVLAAPDVDDAIAKIDLRPGQSDKFRDAQPVTESQEERRGVALAPAAALSGGGDQPLDLIRGQKLARPAIGSTRPRVLPAAAVARGLFHFGRLTPVSCSRVFAPLGSLRGSDCSISGSLWNS